MTSSPAFLYIFRVLVKDGGWRDLVSVLPPETGFTTGLPEGAIVGRLLDPARPLLGGEDEPADLSPVNFAGNPVFRTVFHDVAASFALDDPGLHDEARRLAQRYVYVIDRRTPDPDGHVPSEDIVGGFEVRAGAVVREGYFPNPKYRLLGHNGFFSLDVTSYHRLLAEIARRRTDLYAAPEWIFGAWGVFSGTR